MNKGGNNSADVKSTLCSWKGGGFRGLVREDFRGVFACDPLEWIAGASVELVRSRPSSAVHRCVAGGQVYYAKIITAANDAGSQGKSVSARLKWGLRWSRGVISMRTARLMEAAGLHPAPIVLAARRRRGLGATDVIIMLEVPGRGLLDVLRDDGVHEEEKKSLLQQAGRAIHLMHRSGFMHGDLHPNNLISSGTGSETWLLDNDRTRAWFFPVLWVFRRRNLAQMGYRICLTNAAQFEIFLDAYFAEAALPARRAEVLRGLIHECVKERIAKLREREKTRRGDHSTSGGGGGGAT